MALSAGHLLQVRQRYNKKGSILKFDMKQLYRFLEIGNTIMYATFQDLMPVPINLMGGN
jgi:hypothetical protein